MERKKKQMVPSDGGVAERSRFDYDVQDFVFEILSWLPVKSLLRFRCVCKSWCALISSSCFAKKHLSRAVTSRLQVLEYSLHLFRGGRLRHMDTKDSLKIATSELGLKVANRKLDLPRWCPSDVFSLELGSRMIIVGSCNGLICLQVSQGMFLLWNPCTRDTKMLPELTSFSDLKFYGFGYDSVTDDYKIIVGTESSASGSLGTKVAVCTLKTGSWRTLEGLEHFELAQNGCLSNGALHWLETKLNKDKEDYFRISMRIISFDLAEEEFQEVPSILPERIKQECHTFVRSLIGIGTNRNGLFVYLYDIITALTIWTKEEYGGVKVSWTRLVVKIPSKIFLRQRVSYVDYVSILENGVVLIGCDPGRLSSEMVLYDPKKETSMIVSAPHDQRLKTVESILCLETLVSP
ncbi:hypothetical protein M0R45_032676 [Rubus argutus]|uniref:F-box domain-containing protein n=1 Tax=Rubus argutus TaxID=59490 RepID=A0AAW1WKI1_RUBAR